MRSEESAAFTFSLAQLAAGVHFRIAGTPLAAALSHVEVCRGIARALISSQRGFSRPAARANRCGACPCSCTNIAPAP